MKSKNKTFAKPVSSSMMLHSENNQHCVELNDGMEDMIEKSNTTNSFHHQHINSQEDMRKLITTLEKLLSEANHQKKELEQKLQQHINRSIKREQQFYRIIDIYVARTNNSSQSFNTIRSLDEDNIKNLYNQLNDRVEQSDQKLKQKYEQLYEENLKIMERKITSLTEKMQQELKKTKRITNDQTGEMKNMMMKLGDMAVEVQGRNGELLKKNDELELKVQMLNEQKRLLLQQILQKKNLLRSYHNKCKQYESRLKQNPINSIQPIAVSNSRPNNSIESVSKKKSISQASNINNKPFNEYVGMTMSLGLNDNGGIASDFIRGSGNKTSSNIHSQKRKQNLISRNFSVSTKNKNINSQHSHYKHFTSHKKSTQLNRNSNQKTIQQSENNVRIFSTEFVTSHEIIKLEKVRNEKVGRKNKKDYISSLTMARTNTPMQQHGHITISSNSPTKFPNQTMIRDNNNKLTTSTTQQSSNQALFFKENPTHNINKNAVMNTNKSKQGIVDNNDDNQQIGEMVSNNKNNGCHLREMNAVKSIRNVANREKQKKIQCMSRLAELQRKLTAIDGLVSDALLELSLLDVDARQGNSNRSGFKQKPQGKSNRSGLKQKPQGESSSREQVLSLAKVLCDQLKNIITTNYNSSNLNHSNITQNYISHSYYYPTENGYYTVPINHSQRETPHISPLDQQLQQEELEGKQITTVQLIKLLDGELRTNIN